MKELLLLFLFSMAYWEATAVAEAGGNNSSEMQSKWKASTRVVERAESYKPRGGRGLYCSPRRGGVARQRGRGGCEIQGSAACSGWTRDTHTHTHTHTNELETSNGNIGTNFTMSCHTFLVLPHILSLATLSYSCHTFLVLPHILSLATHS